MQTKQTHFSSSPYILYQHHSSNKRGHYEFLVSYASYFDCVRRVAAATAAALLWRRRRRERGGRGEGRERENFVDRRGTKEGSFCCLC